MIMGYRHGSRGERTWEEESARTMAHPVGELEVDPEEINLKTREWVALQAELLNSREAKHKRRELGGGSIRGGGPSAADGRGRA